jgi:hypothetical protein
MSGDQSCHLIGRHKAHVVDELAELVVGIRQWRSCLGAQVTLPSSE